MKTGEIIYTFLSLYILLLDYSVSIVRIGIGLAICVTMVHVLTIGARMGKSLPTFITLEGLGSGVEA